MKKNIYEINNYHQILLSFSNKCKENSIWYSLGGKSLLSAMTSINYFNQDDYLEVFMSLDSFKKLQALFPKNVVDSNSKNRYYFLTPFFVEPNCPIVIKINILVPAGIKKSEKFYTIKNLIRQQIGFWSSYNEEKYWFKKLMYKFLSLFFSNLTWYEVYATMYDEKYNGYFVVDSFAKNINQHWIPSVTFRTKNISFVNIECPIIEESEIYLNKRFGFKWKDEFNANDKSLDFNWVVGFSRQ